MALMRSFTLFGLLMNIVSRCVNSCFALNVWSRTQNCPYSNSFHLSIRFEIGQIPTILRGTSVLVLDGSDCMCLMHCLYTRSRDVNWFIVKSDYNSHPLIARDRTMDSYIRLDINRLRHVP